MVKERVRERGREQVIDGGSDESGDHPCEADKSTDRPTDRHNPSIVFTCTISERLWKFSIVPSACTGSTPRLSIWCEEGRERDG